MEQLLPRPTKSSSAGARGAAALWEQKQLLHWSTWNSCFPRAQRASLQQPLSRNRYRSSTASCVPAELSVLREAEAPCAPVEQLYLLLESRCSTCSGRSALCAPGKQLLHVLQWSCGMCFHAAAPAELQWRSSICSQKAIAALCCAACSPSLCVDKVFAFNNMADLFIRIRCHRYDLSSTTKINNKTNVTCTLKILDF